MRGRDAVRVAMVSVREAREAVGLFVGLWRELPRRIDEWTARTEQARANDYLIRSSCRDPAAAGRHWQRYLRHQKRADEARRRAHEDGDA